MGSHAGIYVAEAGGKLYNEFSAEIDFLRHITV
jgi:hypothetical protein